MAIHQCCQTTHQFLVGASISLPGVFPVITFVQWSLLCKIRTFFRHLFWYWVKFLIPWVCSFWSISGIGCPLPVAALTPPFTSHSHLPPLCWDYQSFWQLWFFFSVLPLVPLSIRGFKLLWSRMRSKSQSHILVSSEIGLIRVLKCLRP